jgi:L,D-transpeptidase YcbB
MRKISFFVFFLSFISLSMAKAEGTVASDIQALLQASRHPALRWGNFSDVSKGLTRLYAESPAKPLWVKDSRPTAQALAVVAALKEADAVGLVSEDYDASLLDRWGQEAPDRFQSASNVAAYDVGLSIAALRFATNLRVGRVNPRSVGFDLDVAPRKQEIPSRVLEMTRSPSPRVLLSDLEPRFPIYQPLKRALARYRTLATDLPRPKFSFPAKFTPGMTNKDVPALRELLIALGDLQQGGAVQEGRSEVYDPQLEQAVKAFQSRHGLTADGVIGKGTLSRLSVPVADRLKQIELGLERLRWLSEGVRGHYLIVNIPSFQLYGARAGEGLGHHELQMNVVVGQAIDGRQTPVFHSDMTMVTFRPYWNVPEAIAAKEVVPEIRRSPAYLQKNNLEIVPAFAPAAVPLSADSANLDRVAGGSLKIRQRPGPDNALGLFKFSFPNVNNVYLHSTPSKGLFSRDRRDFSHGCIRVQDPQRLAEWVLEENGDWPPERIAEFANGEVTKTIMLKKPIPVYILYSTVMVDQEGRISFFDDIYGHDRTLQVLLSRGFPYPN